MRIAVPRERKTLEQRVALTPQGAAKLVAAGHEVYVETNAGIGSHFSDEEYRLAGCAILSTLEQTWGVAELLVKVKEPDPAEFKFFRSDLSLFCFLHLASLPSVARSLADSGVTAFAYENLTLPDRRLPLLEPMSEVAGKLSVINGAYYLLSQNGGRGILLGGAGSAPPARVVILGAGIAGIAACSMAVGLGAGVEMLDIDSAKLDALKAVHGSKVTATISTPESIANACKGADLLIGAVLVPGAATPRLITHEHIRSMGKGAVFVDISIDQGGCAETSRPTNLNDPTFCVHDVIHYGVCNMPAQTPLTSTLALANTSLPYIEKLAYLLSNTKPLPPEFESALTCQNGEITNTATRRALGL